jgi:predicted alpha/beta hydrolase family esterase
LKLLKSSSEDWDNPLLKDWLESLNSSIESAEGKSSSLQPCLLINQSLVKKTKSTK